MATFVPLSYGIAGLAFALLAALLMIGGRASAMRRWLVALAIAMSLWGFATLGIFLAQGSSLELLSLLSLVDGLRAFAWLLFFLRLAPGLQLMRPVLMGASILGVAYLAIDAFWPGLVPVNLRFAVLLGLSLIGLLVIEQVFRNAGAEERKVLGRLCIPIGGLFAYDLFVYSDAVLIGMLDATLWAARGLLAVVAVPMLVVAAKSHDAWARDLFISRQMVFYSATLLGVGIYFLAMAAGGYFILQRGGEWGRAWQMIFFIAAVLLLATVLFSGEVRAKAKVFVTKHFYRNRYDYREEWLRLIGTLSADEASRPLGERSIKTLADILASPGGELWRSFNNNEYELAAFWPAERVTTGLSLDPAVADFMERTQWIIDTDEYREDPAAYKKAFGAAEVSLPAHRIIVPLIHQRGLVGVVTLVRPSELPPLNYEDHDLLKTAGRQVARIPRPANCQRAAGGDPAIRGVQQTDGRS